MSDRGKEVSPPPSSKRTQRYQQQVEQPNKRTLLKVLGIGGAAAALGGVGLAWKALSQPKSETPPRPPTSPPVPTSTQELLPRETIQYYQRELQNLNQEVFRNPQSFKEIAPRIGNLAVAYFCSEMGYDPKEFEGRIKYLWSDDHKRIRLEESSCIIQNTPDDQYGGIMLDKDWLGVNLTTILYGFPHEGKPRGTAAITLFSTLIHELHHLKAPLLDDPEINEPGVKIRGVGRLRPVPGNSKTDLVCYEAVRKSLEEAIVEESTDRMVSKIGIGRSPIEDYSRWVSNYRRSILNPLFNGDNKPLLRLHQQSKPKELFELVGIKLGATKQTDARKMGEDYLVKVLSDK
ncbi:MAG: hypothetical protein G01um10147_892 [Microgenomates group bacterium Gr01-1014_7]|nr:MAG: hypothetical protein G01um10147_892 [Microgenomates group bacterium Gr01-1014_7]